MRRKSISPSRKRVGTTTWTAFGTSQTEHTLTSSPTIATTSTRCTKRKRFSPLKQSRRTGSVGTNIEETSNTWLGHKTRFTPTLDNAPKHSFVQLPHGRRHAVSERRKGWRKRQRKIIHQSLGSSTSWLETVAHLQNQGIPLSLILAEANRYGIDRVKKEVRSE